VESHSHLVLSVDYIIGFFVYKSQQFLLELQYFELKVFIGLLYKELSVVYPSLPAAKLDSKIFFIYPLSVDYATFFSSWDISEVLD